MIDFTGNIRSLVQQIKVCDPVVVITQSTGASSILLYWKIFSYLYFIKLNISVWLLSGHSPQHY